MNKNIRITLTALLSLNILSNFFIFVVLQNSTVSSWVLANLCSVAEFIALIGLFSRNKTILTAAVPSLLVFAIGGLFSMS